LIIVMPLKTAGMLDAILERQRFMEYLSQNGVDTTPPLHSQNGNLAESLLDGAMASYSWCMVQGEPISVSDPRRRQDFYAAWGKMLGKMHRLAKLYPQWQASAAIDAWGDPLISRRHEYNHFCEWIRDDEVRAAWISLNAELDSFPLTRENHGFVHNDAHPGNILIRDGRLILIDFDVSNFLWFILDLAICVFSEFAHVQHHSPHRHLLPQMDELFLQPFMRAYESENVLPESDYAAIETFIRYRRFIMFAAFYDQIKTNAPDYLEIMKGELIRGDAFFMDGKEFVSRWR
ncbi:MAG: phosphotransferase, partial [Candidatus Cloacimonadaceae bacterium]|nr:phosphotransferase [Candidatus Cloacimonadaceae bacterium]